MTKRILFFQPNNNYSGSCRVLLTTIQESFKDYDYKVVTMRKDGFLSQLPSNRVFFMEYPLFFGRILHGPSYLLHCIKLFFVAIFYGFSYREFYINTIMPFPAAIAGRFMGCKITYHVHEKFIKPDIRERIAEWVMTHIRAKRIYVSYYLKNAYNDEKANSEVRYNKLSQDFLDNVKVVPVENRNRNTIILVSAIASREKGIDLFHNLAELCPQYCFHLVTGSTIEEVKQFINKPFAENFCVVQGGGNVGYFLQKADIIINLSNPRYSTETFGMSILEGMAYGLPAIVPNAGGPLELVKDGFNGYCVDVTDLKMIKDLIQEILKEENYRMFCDNALSQFKRING